MQERAFLIKLFYKANRKNADIIRICVHCIWNQSVANTTNSNSALLLFSFSGGIDTTFFMNSTKIKIIINNNNNNNKYPCF